MLSVAALGCRWSHHPCIYTDGAILHERALIWPCIDAVQALKYLPRGVSHIFDNELNWLPAAARKEVESAIQGPCEGRYDKLRNIIMQVRLERAAPCVYSTHGLRKGCPRPPREDLGMVRAPSSEGWLHMYIRIFALWHKCRIPAARQMASVGSAR